MFVTIERKLRTVSPDFVSDRMKFNLLAFCSYPTVVKVDPNKTGLQNKSVSNTRNRSKHF